jgi:EAL domain-containing protein (putative c-di-GMP-specific phosphodiesterase class I)
MGVSICLDDFGAGAAGFQYIRDFPVDFIKVDGSYVRAAPVHARQRAILYSIMEMAQTIGARTIAEFVETEEQARLVESMGGQFIQGWLVGKPGPLMTIDSLVRGSGLRR